MLILNVSGYYLIRGKKSFQELYAVNSERYHKNSSDSVLVSETKARVEKENKYKHFFLRAPVATESIRI